VVEILALRQGRQGDFDRVQAVEQVGAEAAGLDGFFQVRVGGGDKLDIDGPAGGAADGADRPVVQQAEQDALQLHRHVADFIQEQGAAVRLVDQTFGAAAPCSGEGALGVAEQFGFDQGVGEGGTVHGDEGAGAATDGVGVAGHQFLAGSGGASDQDRDASGGGSGDLGEQGGYGRIFGDEIGRGRAGRGAGLGLGFGLRMAVERADLVQVVDRHDVAAALVVFQPYPVAAVAFVQEVEEAGAEQFGEVVSRPCRQALQEERGLGAGGDDRAAWIDRQQAGAEGPQVFCPRVEDQHQIVAVKVAEQAVLDLADRHLDQCHGMALAGAAIARRVQYAGDLARGAEDRGGVAGQPVIHPKEMLGAVDRHRGFHGRRQTQRVGALLQFSPQAAGADVLRLRRGAESVVGDGVQHHAGGIAQRDHEVGTGDLVIEVVHFGERQSARQLVPVARFAHGGVVGVDRFGRAARVEARFQAAFPGLADFRRQRGRTRVRSHACSSLVPWLEGDHDDLLCSGFAQSGCEQSLIM